MTYIIITKEKDGVTIYLNSLINNIYIYIYINFRISITTHFSDLAFNTIIIYIYIYIYIIIVLKARSEK